MSEGGEEEEEEDDDEKAGGEEEQEQQHRAATLLSLLPAPTPTRFVGKMHMKMEERRTPRKSSSTTSRRSSIAPTTETIQGSRTPRLLPTPRFSNVNFREI